MGTEYAFGNSNMPNSNDLGIAISPIDNIEEKISDGNIARFNLRVANYGTSDEAIKVELYLSSGIHLESSNADCIELAGKITCDFGILMHHSVKERIISIRVDNNAQGKQSVMGILSNSNDPNPENNQSKFLFEIPKKVTTKADLQTSIGFGGMRPAPFVMYKGESNFFQISWQNHGPEVASDVVGKVTLSPGLRFNPSVTSSECEIKDDTATCKIGTLPINDKSVNYLNRKVSFIGVRMASDASSPQSITAEISGNVNDDAIKNNNLSWSFDVVSGTPTREESESFRPPIDDAADLGVVIPNIIQGAIKIQPGDLKEFKLEYYNRGPAKASGVKILIKPTNGLTLESVQGCTITNNKSTCEVGDLKSQEKGLIPLIQVRVDSNAQGVVSVSSSITSYNPNDPNPYNQSFKTEYDVTQIPQIIPPLAIIHEPSLSDGVWGDSFAISDNKIIFGVKTSNQGGRSSGMAYLYDTSGKILQEFANPSPDIGDQFGYAVSISKDSLLVSAPADDTSGENNGAVYLFDGKNGNLLQTLYNPTPSQNGDAFGVSVGISKNHILVGAPADDYSAEDAGVAYLFDTAGNLLHTFYNPTPSKGDVFGHSVAISENNVLVGAFSKSAGAKYSGAAYLFDARDGKLVRTFTSPNPVEVGGFGYSVAISGDHVLIGRTGNGHDVYLFDKSGNLLQTFSSPNPPKNESDSFGNYVSISGNHALIGAPVDDTIARHRGAAYLFDISTGNQVQRFLNPMFETSWSFGRVSISDKNIIIGFADSSTFLQTTSGYIYSTNNKACSDDSKFDYSTNSCIISNQNRNINSYKIPSWIKNVSSFWCQDKISDADFIAGVEFLIKHQIITVPKTDSDALESEIPSWVKESVCFWSEDKISDNEIMDSLQYLIKSGIISVI
jgi:hypothetical protein